MNIDGCSFYFYPRPPRGERLQRCCRVHSFGLFLSTPSARRATGGGRLSDLPAGISIHALREESDYTTNTPHGREVLFLSTPSARRATKGGLDAAQRLLFLSTPSARRATAGAGRQRSASADFYPRPPRGERLMAAGVAAGTAQDFYPRPPRGERRPSYRHSRHRQSISIHALREESDPKLTIAFKRSKLFLSTPSARRATAKTERKHPAFVSLYTSLHKLQRDAYKTNRKITPLLAQTAGIPVRSVPENHVCCRFALAGHQKISTLSWANSGCSPTCSTLVW